MAFRDARPLIPHGDVHAVGGGRRSEFDHGPVRRVADGVADQVADGLLGEQRVGVHRQAGAGVACQANAPCFRGGAQFGLHPIEQAIHRDVGHLEALPRARTLHEGERKQVLHERAEPRRVAVHDVQEASRGFRILHAHLQQRLDIAADVGDGGAQLVTDVGREIAAHAIERARRRDIRQQQQGAGGSARFVGHAGHAHLGDQARHARRFDVALLAATRGERVRDGVVERWTACAFLEQAAARSLGIEAQQSSRDVVGIQHVLLRIEDHQSLVQRLLQDAPTQAFVRGGIAGRANRCGEFAGVPPDALERIRHLHRKRCAPALGDAMHGIRQAMRVTRQSQRPHQPHRRCRRAHAGCHGRTGRHPRDRDGEQRGSGKQDVGGGSGVHSTEAASPSAKR